MPGWADFNDGDMFYGFPTSKAAGSSSPTICTVPPSTPTPRTAARPQAALDEIIAFRDRRFPLLQGAPLTEARVCQYENSSNGDFLIDFHPRLRECAAGRRRLRPRLQARAGGRPLRGGAAVRTQRTRTALQPRHQGRNPPTRGALIRTPAMSARPKGWQGYARGDAMLRAFLMAASLCAPAFHASASAAETGKGHYLFVFTGDQKSAGKDFLAVIDADPSSPKVRSTGHDRRNRSGQHAPASHRI